MAVNPNGIKPPASELKDGHERLATGGLGLGAGIQIGTPVNAENGKAIESKLDAEKVQAQTVLTYTLTDLEREQITEYIKDQLQPLIKRKNKSCPTTDLFKVEKIDTKIKELQIESTKKPGAKGYVQDIDDNAKTIAQAVFEIIENKTLLSLDQVDRSIEESLRSLLPFKLIRKKGKFDPKKDAGMIQNYKNCFVMSNLRIITSGLEAVKLGLPINSKVCEFHIYRNGVQLKNSGETISLDFLEDYMSDLIDPQFSESEKIKGTDADLITMPDFESVSEMIENVKEFENVNKINKIREQLEKDRSNFVKSLSEFNKRAIAAARHRYYRNAGLVGVVVTQALGGPFIAYIPAYLLQVLSSSSAIALGAPLTKSIFERVAALCGSNLLTEDPKAESAEANKPQDKKEIAEDQKTKAEANQTDGVTINRLDSISLEKRFDKFKLFVIQSAWDPEKHSEKNLGGVKNEDGSYKGVGKDFSGIILVEKKETNSSSAQLKISYISYIYLEGVLKNQSEITTENFPIWASNFISDKTLRVGYRDPSHSDIEEVSVQQANAQPNAAAQAKDALSMENKYRHESGKNQTQDLKQAQEIEVSQALLGVPAEVGKPNKPIKPKKPKLVKNSKDRKSYDEKMRNYKKDMTAYQLKIKQFEKDKENYVNYLRLMEFLTAKSFDKSVQNAGWWGTGVGGVTFGTAGFANFFVQRSELATFLGVSSYTALGYKAFGELGGYVFDQGGCLECCWEPTKESFTDCFQYFGCTCSSCCTPNTVTPYQDPATRSDSNAKPDQRKKEGGSDSDKTASQIGGRAGSQSPESQLTRASRPSQALAQPFILSSAGKALQAANLMLASSNDLGLMPGINPVLDIAAPVTAESPDPASNNDVKPISVGPDSSPKLLADVPTPVSAKPGVLPAFQSMQSPSSQHSTSSNDSQNRTVKLSTPSAASHARRASTGAVPARNAGSDSVERKRAAEATSKKKSVAKSGKRTASNSPEREREGSDDRRSSSSSNGSVKTASPVQPITNLAGNAPKGAPMPSVKEGSNEGPSQEGNQKPVEQPKPKKAW